MATDTLIDISVHIDVSMAIGISIHIFVDTKDEERGVDFWFKSRNRQPGGGGFLKFRVVWDFIGEACGIHGMV